MAVLLFIDSLLLLLIPLLFVSSLLFGLGFGFEAPQIGVGFLDGEWLGSIFRANPTAGLIVIPLLFLASGALLALTAINLWRLRKWARRVTILLVGFSLFSFVLQSVSSFGRVEQGNALSALANAFLCALILLYLFKPDVKRAFGLN